MFRVICIYFSLFLVTTLNFNTVFRQLKQEIVEVYQQMKQMVNDLGGGEMGHRCTTRISTHQVEPRQALAEVQSGSLQLLLRKLREQMEHAVNMRVNQVQ